MVNRLVNSESGQSCSMVDRSQVDSLVDSENGVTADVTAESVLQG